MKFSRSFPRRLYVYLPIVLAFFFTLNLLCFVSTSSGEPPPPITFWGLEDFVRGKGRPITENREISIEGLEAPFTLHLKNGDQEGNHRASNAQVWLNGELLFGPSDFSQQISGYDIPIALIEPSILEVRMASAPGSKITISIEGHPTGPLTWIKFPGVIEGKKSDIEVLESSGTHLKVKTSLPGMYRLLPMEMPDGITYTPISAPGAGLFEQGKPNLPVFGEWILIPNGTEAHFEIDPGEPLVFENIKVPPGQPLPSDSEIIPLPFTKDQEVYAAEGNYPGIFAWMEPTKIIRGQACAIVWLYPYQYNPVKDTLAIYPNLTVTVLFNGEPTPVPLELKSEAFDLLKQRTAINFDAVVKAQDANPGPIVTPYDVGPPNFGPYGWDYIIMTKPEFEYAANQLAAWREKTGFKTTVFIVPDGWQAKDIKKALEGAYKNWGKKPEYILIIGDAEHIPCFYETWHPMNEKYQKKCDCYKCDSQPPFRESYVCTDFYYTTMDGNDLIPDIAIGRLSVDSHKEAVDRVEKIIEFEQNPVRDSSFYNHAAICTQFEDMNIKVDNYYNPTCSPDTYEDHRRAQSAEDLALFLEDPYYGIEKEITRIYNANSNINPKHWSKDPQNFDGQITTVGGPIPKDLWRSNGFGWSGGPTNIINALNPHWGLVKCHWTEDYTGQFLLVYRGHGGKDNWRAPSLYIDRLNDLKNCNRLPVVWSLACNTGWFDNETDFNRMPDFLKNEPLVDYTAVDDISFSEKWERLESGGAIGVLASTRVSYAYLNDLLLEGMVDAIWPNYVGGGTISMLRMGNVLNFGKIHMLAMVSALPYENPADPFKEEQRELKKKVNCEVYHWFGDPVTEIRIHAPNKIAVANLPEEWPWRLNKRDFSIHADSEDLFGNTIPLKNAKVTLKKKETEEFWVKNTDEEGNVTFPDFVTISSGSYDIVVSAPQSIPFQGSFTSQAGPSGGIILDSKVYSCESELEIKLADVNAWKGQLPFINISASSDDKEKVILDQEEESGMFSGEILTDPADVQIRDGILQVEDGQSITVTYFDDDNGEDGSGLVETTAVVDCQAPDFEGLKSAKIDNGRVVLSWDEAKDLHPPIFYNIYRKDEGTNNLQLINSTWALSYPDHNLVYGRTYIVRAQDAVGNEDDNTIEKRIIAYYNFP